MKVILIETDIKSFYMSYHWWALF